MLDKTLFERIGGSAAVSRMVMDFYDRVLATEQLSPYFAVTDMRRLVEHQAKFVSAVMGGPASYSDQEIRDIHSHLRIDEPAFEALVEIFAEVVADYVPDPADASLVVEAVRLRKPFVVASEA